MVLCFFVAIVQGQLDLRPCALIHRRLFVRVSAVAGLVAPAVLSHLRSLGVTAVELLPIHTRCTLLRVRC